MYQSFIDHIENFKSTYNAKELAIALFDDQEILFEHYTGKRNEQQAPIDRHTIFGIASITKSFTVLSLLKLHQEKKIDIYKPIVDYIPELKFKDDRQPLVVHFMSHTAGYFPQKRQLISDLAITLNITDELSTHGAIEKIGFNNILENLNTVDSYIGMPGEYISYSNDSYGVLTEMVRRYGDEAHFCDYVEKHIIRPLNMNDTFFSFNRTKEENNITTLYQGDIITSDYTDTGFVLMGGGGIKSNINDLIKYTRLYMNDGQDLIQPHLIKEMTIPRANFKPQTYYGLGLNTGYLDDISYAGHSGGLTGVSSFFCFSKDINKGIVVLCNTGGVPVSLIGLAGLRFVHNDSLSPFSVAYNDMKWSNELINKTIGHYKSDEGADIRIFYEDDQLKIKHGETIHHLRTVQENLLLIETKLEKNTMKILRDKNKHAWAIYSGSRIIKKID